MPLLVTDAIVLHSANYLESSRLLRLLTREAGVQSVVARGARTSRKRFGSAVGLFARGQAQIEVRAGRDLHTLTQFDVTNAQAGLAELLSRFSAASAIAECALRVVHEEAAPPVYDGLASALTELTRADGDHTIAVALGALWRLVHEVGFSPALRTCAECHSPIEDDEDATFSHAAGGILCARCAARAPGGRRLPSSARLAILNWIDGIPVELGLRECRAHQRLLREFVAQHLTDGRPLRAFVDWEAGTLDAVSAESF
jgi:DNA repair protein RecO (recombination protein O)